MFFTRNSMVSLFALSKQKCNPFIRKVTPLSDRTQLLIKSEICYIFSTHKSSQKTGLIQNLSKIIGLNLSSHDPYSPPLVSFWIIISSSASEDNCFDYQKYNNYRCRCRVVHASYDVGCCGCLATKAQTLIRLSVS